MLSSKRSRRDIHPSERDHIRRVWWEKYGKEVIKFASLFVFIVTGVVLLLFFSGM